MLSPRRLSQALVIAVGVCAAASQVQAQQQAAPDTARIEQITGLKGTFSKQGDVFKISKPRNDVKVQVDGWTMPPFMGLTSYAAFKPAHGSQVMMMGRHGAVRRRSQSGDERSARRRAGGDRAP
nr:DUF1259 domain-containing protein [Paraburkholderia sp. LEh10]